MLKSRTIGDPKESLVLTPQDSVKLSDDEALTVFTLHDIPVGSDYIIILYRGANPKMEVVERKLGDGQSLRCSARVNEYR